MKNKKYLTLVALCIGMVTVVINILFDIVSPQSAENLGNLRWVMVGIAAGLAGAAVSTILSKKMYKDNPELEKQARINTNDERYIQVRKTAAYYMWFVTTFLLLAMLLVFIVLNLVIATWIALAALMIHIVLYIILLFKINKIM